MFNQGHFHCLIEGPAMSEYVDYLNVKERNRKGFELNFGSDISAFQASFSALRSIWERLGTTRDVSGQSQVGLLVFANILIRHSIFGFESLVAYQSYLAWSNFRSGLEALLILGKLVDDPANAAVWVNRATDLKVDRAAYRNAFTGTALESRSLSRSVDFRKVLTHLNDNFMHPNPSFSYRDTTRIDDGKGVVLSIEFFDLVPELHEAHVLAYLNLFSLIVEDSSRLVARLCGIANLSGGENLYEGANRSRAVQLAASTPETKKIMEELGLWKL